LVLPRGERGKASLILGSASIEQVLLLVLDTWIAHLTRGLDNQGWGVAGVGILGGFAKKYFSSYNLPHHFLFFPTSLFVFTVGGV
jgi:hypothetical protein